MAHIHKIFRQVYYLFCEQEALIGFLQLFSIWNIDFMLTSMDFFLFLSSTNNNNNNNNNNNKIKQNNNTNKSVVF